MGHHSSVKWMHGVKNTVKIWGVEKRGLHKKTPEAKKKYCRLCFSIAFFLSPQVSRTYFLAKKSTFFLFFQSKNKYFLFLLAKLQWTSLYTRIYTAGMQLPRKESFSLGLKFNYSTLIDIITFCGTLFSPTRINVLVNKNLPVYSAWLAGKRELKQSLRNVDKFVFKNITLFLLHM